MKGRERTPCRELMQPTVSRFCLNPYAHLPRLARRPRECLMQFLHWARIHRACGSKIPLKAAFEALFAGFASETHVNLPQAVGDGAGFSVRYGFAVNLHDGLHER